MSKIKISRAFRYTAFIFVVTIISAWRPFPSFLLLNFLLHNCFNELFFQPLIVFWLLLRMNKLMLFNNYRISWLVFHSRNVISCLNLVFLKQIFTFCVLDLNRVFLLFKVKTRLLIHSMELVFSFCEFIELLSAVKHIFLSHLRPLVSWIDRRSKVIPELSQLLQLLLNHQILVLNQAFHLSHCCISRINGLIGVILCFLSFISQIKILEVNVGSLRLGNFRIGVLADTCQILTLRWKQVLLGFWGFARTKAPGCWANWTRIFTPLLHRLGEICLHIRN